ncbi:hypothetical protein C8E00_103468 [Chromohalobacter marismortui]|uniref:Phage abortive infection protein n=1 Tax=Chromohalobacter marismortui TaxID=42055 RepID=A0A4R7NQ74_9GAMM|nr:MULTISPECIES: hypothetical protein [Chromohalobacter]MCI0508615.1 hypothetical protein [Chromohalobacter sp.]TDU23094.1 hypothetical protein C8E00_103468 [Chromohalobacter marismortui]
MGKALRQYWMLVASVLVAAIVAIGLYAVHFHGSSLSDNPGDWADFATYLSGTVGVAVLTATLIALVHTLYQQSVLVRQQDDLVQKQDELIEQQKAQIDQAAAYQVRTDAYQRASSLLPQLMRTLDDNLDKDLREILGDDFFVRHGVFYTSSRARCVDFFENEMVLGELRQEEPSVQRYLGKVVSDDVCAFSKFVSEIVKAAPGLSDHIFVQLRGYRKVILCSLLFKSRMDSSYDWASVLETLGFNKHLESYEKPESEWLLLGTEPAE